MHKITALFFSLMLTACVHDGLLVEERPKAWAQPISVSGISNLHEITPNLFRSAQPEVDGFIALDNKKMVSAQQKEPIKTVLSFRHFHSDADIYPASNVNYVRVPMNTWAIQDSEVVEALRIVTNPSLQPVLLHCQHGADRTGLISALYRILYQGWSKEEAIREMQLGNFGFHPMWQNLIDYINAVDVQKLKQKVDA